MPPTLAVFLPSLFIRASWRCCGETWYRWTSCGNTWKHLYVNAHWWFLTYWNVKILSKWLLVRSILSYCDILICLHLFLKYSYKIGGPKKGNLVAHWKQGRQGPYFMNKLYLVWCWFEASPYCWCGKCVYSFCCLPVLTHVTSLFLMYHHL